ncbi:MAG: ABC transporter permease, partial [Gammaproteobacteria bacterium]|nr:ABC transporter permease [Gammaproteobacteria bacterium]
AALLGLDSRVATFAVQRDINRFPSEPLMAVLPGVALQELWSLLGVAEKALFVVSVFVVLTGLVGMLTAILASLNERRREMAILRSVGARPRHIFTLLLLEAFGLALAGVLLGLGLMYLALWLAQPLILSQYGLFIPITAPGRWDWTLLGAILLAAIVMGAVPAWRAYRQSLIDGLSIRT